MISRLPPQKKPFGKIFLSTFQTILGRKKIKATFFLKKILDIFSKNLVRFIAKYTVDANLFRLEYSI